MPVRDLYRGEVPRYAAPLRCRSDGSADRKKTRSGGCRYNAAYGILSEGRGGDGYTAGKGNELTRSLVIGVVYSLGPALAVERDHKVCESGGEDVSDYNVVGRHDGIVARVLYYKPIAYLLAARYYVGAYAFSDRERVELLCGDASARGDGALYTGGFGGHRDRVGYLRAYRERCIGIGPRLIENESRAVCGKIDAADSEWGSGSDRGG